MGRFAFLILSVAVFIGAPMGPALRAQTNWAAAPSGTTQNLWGICYGGGQFVAVGENGTILTSPDGSIWTKRAGGVSGWMTSITYALNHYVAVGENGTVLVSLDGISWDNVTLRSAGIPGTRLNAVRFNGTEFLAYGEHDAALRIFLPPRLDAISGSRDTDPWLRSVATGFGHIVVGGEAGISVFDPGDPFLVNRNSALVTTGVRNVSGLVSFRDTLVAVGAAGAILTSTNATTWTPQSSGTTVSLNDVANFNNTLIAVGDGGTILSLDERGTWIRRNSSSTSLLLGVAGSDTTAVAVGFGGTILRSLATPMLPAITSQPAAVAETVGGAASFYVQANGSPPLAYQWFRNGVPLAGETRPALIRAPLSAADAADYSVTIANTAGTVSSSVARLNLLPVPAPVVDLKFHAAEFLVGSPTALLPLSDGSVLLAYGSQVNGDGVPRRLAKLRADGSIDPAWTITSFGVADPNSSANIGALAVQPDGRILVGGLFSAVNGQARSNLVRLNRDGTLDTSFAPAPEASARPFFSIAMQADSRILIANGGVTPLRLLADGSLDPSFHPQPLEPGYTIFNEARNWGIMMVAPTADGKVLASASTDLRFTLGFPIPKSQVVRFQSDGTLDASFTPLAWDGFNGNLRALDDGGALVIGAPVPNGRFGASSESIWRLRGDGSPNPAYAMPTLPVIQASYIYSDGAVIFIGSSQQSPVRYTPLGAIDATFTGGIGQPSLIAATNDNQVYVAGAFEVYNGQAAHLVARLNAVANGTLNAPSVLSLAVDKTTVAYGEAVTLRAAVTGSADLTYEWVGVPVSYSNSTFVRTTSPVFTFAFSSDGGGPRSTIKLVARNPRGEAASAPVVFTVLPDPPVVTSQPTHISAQSGRDLSIAVQRNSAAGAFLDYEWRRNGQTLATPPGGFLGPPLVIPKVSAADAGIYTITLRNALGVAGTSAPIVVTIDDSSRLANLSTRAFVGPGEQTLIAGFSISGEQTRRVLIRVVGPALAKFGVSDALSNPQIRLIEIVSHTDHSVVFSSDGWDANSTDGSSFLRGEFAKLGAFPFDTGSKDNAGVAQLAPGNYTVQVTNKTGLGGTALVEIYEDDNDAARMLNVSSRALVTPASPAICGLSIQGLVPKRIVLRGVGPGLSVFGIAGVLANPRLTLKDARGVSVATNDDWETSASVNDLRAAISTVGAFALPASSKDSALLVTLASGNYTMIVEGAPGQSGVALIEAYEVP